MYKYGDNTLAEQIASVVANENILKYNRSTLYPGYKYRSFVIKLRLHTLRLPK